MRLRDGLHELAANLQTLSISLDAVVFRDTWRAVAVAAMRLLFNDIATEAQFSPEVSYTHICSKCASPDSCSAAPYILTLLLPC